MALRFVVVLLIFSAVMTGCSDSTGPGTPQESATVAATASNRFSPATATIFVNGSVTWQFGVVAHNVIFTGGVPGSPANIDATSSNNVQRVFGTVGDFGYTCTLHSGMNGVVRVRARP